MAGLFLAVGYLLLFQCCGICISFCVLKRESFLTALLFGSVAGIVMLQWFPVLFSFLLGFSPAGHVFAAAAAAAAAVTTLCLGKAQLRQLKMPDNLLRAHPMIPVLLLTFLFFCYLVLHGFTRESGAVYSSQATYGDMSMHLGFITSIARQKMFPPEYSILPGAKLNYPFLSDSVSSSLLLLGAPLRLAYALPMFFAGAQVLCSVYLLAFRMLKDRVKAAAAWFFFIFNGGFGIVYFLDGTADFTRIFTAFYETPTNLYTENIRWVNVIVDMLLPQRATLFGWAVLFPALYLLYRAAFQSQRRDFALAGVLLGTLPMIHTHSFLFAALLGFGWFFAAMVRQMPQRIRQNSSMGVKILILAAVILLNTFQTQLQALEQQQGGADCLLRTGIFILAVFIAAVLILTLRRCVRGGFRSLLFSWGILLGVVLLLAMPQLLFWTFTNTQSLVLGHFNWGNLSDNYLLFYLKNIGVVAVLLPFALCFGKQSALFQCLLPAGLVWGIAELIQFQPNTYDNNKLLYPAYLLLCIAAAEFSVDLLRRLRRKPIRAGLLAVLLIFSGISAVLTMGREAVASYPLFGRAAVELAAYVEENTRPEDIFLTDQRHNNEIAALTGRNIVCGSSSFLYYHGQAYSAQAEAVRQMYEAPENALELFRKYKVNYVLISNYERSSFAVSEGSFAQLFDCVYNRDDIVLYRVAAAE